MCFVFPGNLSASCALCEPLCSAARAAELCLLRGRQCAGEKGWGRQGFAEGTSEPLSRQAGPRGCPPGQWVAARTLGEAGCCTQGCSSFPVAIATTGDVVVTAGIPGLMGLQERCGFKASSELTHSHSGERGRHSETVQLCCWILPGHGVVPPARAPRVGRSWSQVWQTVPQPCQALQRLWQPPKLRGGQGTGQDSAERSGQGSAD